jgi:hypothetical protein
MDFTLETYKNLLESILDSDYSIQTFEEFIQDPLDKVVVLRHDVDERPYNALKMAELESSMGIRATYYFRIVKISNVPEVIQKIAALGHEIGYHYEDYSLSNGNLEKAITSFKENLSYFRTFYPVTTCCMHGSSFSGFDNRIIWKHYKLTDFSLIAEPYLSIDYSKVFYITDTARCWDAGKYSIRDKVANHFNLTFHKSNEMISAINNGTFPNNAIIQSHTLWTDNLKEWLWLEAREFIRNRIKLALQKLPFFKKMAYKLIQSRSN